MNELAHKLYREAWLDADRKDYDSAIAKLDHALRFSERSSVLLVTKAQFLYDKGCFEEAIQFARKSTQSSAKNHHAWILSGKLYMKLGKTDEAIDCFRLAIDLVDDYSTRTLLASALLSTDPHGAKRQAEKAIEMKPDWTEAVDILRAATSLLSDVVDH